MGTPAHVIPSQPACRWWLYCTAKARRTQRTAFFFHHGGTEDTEGYTESSRRAMHRRSIHIPRIFIGKAGRRAPESSVRSSCSPCLRGKNPSFFVSFVPSR